MVAVKYHYGKFPPKNLDWNRLIPLLGKTSAAVARFDEALSAVPNTRILLSPLTTQEAVLSSKIEGTVATMAEVLDFEAQGPGKTDYPEERKKDIYEILNYRKAMISSLEMLEKLPLCNRIVRDAHRILLDSVRGEGKSPGEYRKIANWIGPPGCEIEQAKFVPIDAGHLPGAMSNWEKFINSKELDSLVQLAIIHAEFESIHPFLDGNGRLGRMLVPLFMFQVGLIQSPVFYISAYLEANRDSYVERLLAVSRDNDWTGWCVFFLEAIRQQAEENLEKTRAILELYDSTKTKIQGLTRSFYTLQAHDWIFKRPMFKGSDFVKSASIPAPTAKRILTVLRKESIIKVYRKSGGSRSAAYVFTELMNIAEGKKVF